MDHPYPLENLPVWKIKPVDQSVRLAPFQRSVEAVLWSNGEKWEREREREREREMKNFNQLNELNEEQLVYHYQQEVFDQYLTNKQTDCWTREHHAHVHTYHIPSCEDGPGYTICVAASAESTSMPCRCREERKKRRNLPETLLTPPPPKKKKRKKCTFDSTV